MFKKIDEVNKDITHWFIFEHSFITDLESFLNKNAISYYIESLEDSVIYTITLEDFNHLPNIFPKAENCNITNYLIVTGQIALSTISNPSTAAMTTFGNAYPMR